MAYISKDVHPRDGIPHLYAVLSPQKEIAACRGDTRAIGRPGHGVHCTRMIEAKDGQSRVSIPNLHGFIIACRGDARAIRRPGHRRYLRFMPGEGQHLASTAGIPDLYCLVFAPGGNARAIWRPCHGMHWLRVAFISENMHPCGRVPYLHHVLASKKTIATCRGDPLVYTKVPTTLDSHMFQRIQLCLLCQTAALAARHHVYPPLAAQARFLLG